MSVTSSSSSTTTQNIQAQLEQLKKTSLSSTLGGAKPANTTQSVISTSNTAVFQMANLVSKVRALNNQAGLLRSSDTTGVAALRTQVNDALAQFNSIASSTTSALNAAAGGLTAAAALTASSAVTSSTTATTANASLADLQKTLSTMQDNLHANITKVGVSISKAIATGAAQNSSDALASAVSTKYSSGNLYALFNKLYGTNSTRL